MNFDKGKKKSGYKFIEVINKILKKEPITACFFNYFFSRAMM